MCVCVCVCMCVFIYEYIERHIHIRTFIYIHVHTLYMSINNPGNQGPIVDGVLLKTHKMVLDVSVLNTQHYKVRMKGKWNNPDKGIAHFPTHRSSSY